MKNNILIFCALAFCVSATGSLAFPPKRTDKGYAKAVMHGAETYWDLTVVDDDGQPVEGAEVTAVFECGDRFRHGRWKTDSKGNAAVKGLTTGDSIVVNITKNGYYSSSTRSSYLRFAENRPVEHGKWQPWGEKKNIRLRKIINPIPMFKTNATLSVPVTNVWLSLDLKCGDWVEPFGNGKIADCDVLVIWDGKPPYYSKLCKTEIRFSGMLTGAYEVPNVQESKMPYPLRADTNAVYRQTFEYCDRIDGKKMRKSLLPEFTRVARLRCVVSNKRELISANYCGLRCVEASPGEANGKAVLGLSCVFNPTPNDTNLEDIEAANRYRAEIRLREEMKKNE